MRLAIDHRLTLTLPQGISQAVFHLLLTPLSGPTQTVENWSIDMPGIGNAARFVDGFGNVAHLVNLSRPDSEIVVEVRGTVTTRDTHGVLGRPAGEPVPALYRRITALTKSSAGLAAKFRNGRQSRLDTLHALMARVGEQLGLPEAEPAQKQMQADGGQAQSQSAPEAKALPPAADHAHAFIGAARALDIPARYVIGYRFAEGEATLHAWAEAFDDGLGWIGFDPKWQVCSTDAYVRLALGLDAETAVAVRTVPAVEVVDSIKLAQSSGDAA